MDDLRRIDLNLLLSLHALLAEKHVTRAALRLHKSQPAVSHALAQLRDIFQDPLLTRRGAQMVLTPRATELMVPLEAALQQLNELLHTSSFQPQHAQRRFRIAMSDYAARLLLPHLMQQLRQQAPGVDLTLLQASRDAMLVQLADGDMDLALGVFPSTHPDICCQTLFTEHFISAADRSSLPANKQLSLDEWLARPHALVATKPDETNEIDAALAAQGWQRRIALVLPHWGAAAQAIVGTDLVLTVASQTLQTGSFRQLARFAPPCLLPSFDFQMAWHVRREQDMAHRWLRGLIAARFLNR